MNQQQLMPTQNKSIDISNSFTMNKLAIHEKSRILLIDYNDILYCKAESNYTIIYLEDNKKIIVSKCLKIIIERIKSNHFLRIHASFYVNRIKINSVEKNERWNVNIGGKELPISRSRLSLILDTFSY